ncbi:MAG TPA: TVP38/TMEM64 family protein [Thermoanaerobaculia bacterium]|jgi:uncharacterized membrane protein YdjX (TVP38/TMEM64 family)|nr:TVP38/TMEM64 family protein [Thermoanaerobaculia bacterium]
MRHAKPVIIALLVIAAIIALWLLPVGPWLKTFQAYVKSAGPMGYVIYALGYALIALVFPGSVLTIGAGAIFGIVGGTIVVATGATLTATIAFLLARTVLRNRVERMTKDNAKFRAVDQAIAKEGTKIVLLVRLAAVFPFTIVNYAFGLTGIRLVPYVLTTAIGILPGTIAFVYIGAAAASVATQDRTKLAFTIAGLVIAIAVSIFVARLAHNAIQRSGMLPTPTGGNDEQPPC